MSSKPELRLDWCSHQAAKYAVEHWHYSKRMPSSKMVNIGVWENEKFIGAVIFGIGANNNIGNAYKVKQTDICELVRVALTVHVSPVSKIVAIAVKMLRRQSSGIRVIVSYADPVQDHYGGIYQAMNWIFDGQQQGQTEYMWKGEQRHGRSCTSTRGTTVGLPKVKVPGKYRYLMPLDAAMREQIAPLAKPYPKRPRAESVDSDTSTSHVEEGSANLTSALQGDTDRTLEAAR